MYCGSHLEAWNDEYNLSWSSYANILAWQCNKTVVLYVWKQTVYKFSCIYFHLAAILKMEKSKMANEKFLTRKVQRTNSKSLTLVSGSAWFSWKTCLTRSTNIGFRSLEIYSGVWLFNALYIKTALLNFSLSATESQPSSLNINADDVLNSACEIIRAARFCNFAKRSMFALEVAPQETEP